MAAFDFFRRQLSWHYLAGVGESLWRTLGGFVDETTDAAAAGVKGRLPRIAAQEALPDIARTHNLDYPTRIPVEQVREYLFDPWTHYADAGTKGRLIAELNFLGYSRTEVVSYRDLVDTYGKPDTVFGGFSSFFYVIIKKPNPWTRSGLWNAANARWNAAQYTWNSTATASEIREIKQAIAKWKPAASSCRFVEVWLEVNLFGAPTKIVRWPVREYWEYDSNGGAVDFYNRSY